MTRITELFERYYNKTASPDEVMELMKLISGKIDPAVLEDMVRQAWDKNNSPAQTFSEEESVRMLQQIKHQMHFPVENLESTPLRRISSHTSVIRRWIAAAVVIIMATSAFLWVNNKNKAIPQSVTEITNDIDPGKDGAILTLADGSQVVLDSLGNGLIAAQNGAELLIKDGQLVYDPTGEANAELTYNTMYTPKGRQFNLLLPDGTRVWLNAASTIRYPTVFIGSERKVEISGEAYFEVARNSKMPFLVNVNNKTEVEVLGTHFNVNAYEDAGTINTTLLEGSVRTSILYSGGAARHGRPVILKPGQQAVVFVGENKDPEKVSEIKIIRNADLEKVSAWRNGLFNFRDATLEEIMRQFERWYNIEVVYEQHVPEIELAGELNRSVPLNDLLPAIGKMGVNYRLEGRKLIVLP